MRRWRFGGWRVKRLSLEPYAWELTAEAIGQRYLAGHNPLFGDIREQLQRTRVACEELIAKHNVAFKGRRLKGGLGPIDVKGLRLEARTEVDGVINQLVEPARTQVNVMLGAQQGALSLKTLLEGELG